MLKLVFFFMFSLLVANAKCCGQDSNDASKSSDPFRKTIRPLLERYCAECHAPGDMKDLDFLAAEKRSDIDKFRDIYASVVEQMENQAMPPKDFKQPTDNERRLVTKWIKETLELNPADFDRISAYVVEAFEDKKGNLWFGTASDGAARYDGKSLTYMSTKEGLIGDTVTGIAEDKEGNMWFGTHSGASKYDGKSFTNFSISEGLSGAGCNFLLDRKGIIWAGTDDGVFRFDGLAFSKYAMPAPTEKMLSHKVKNGKVWCLFEDKAGNIWFGLDGRGAFKFDGVSFTHFTKKDGLSSNNVSSIVEDNRRNIWFGCLSSDHPEYVNEGGLIRYDGANFTQFPEVKGLAANDIYSLYTTKAGEIWIGATGVGAYRYDGKVFTLFDKTDRKFWTRHFGVQSILEDRKGTMWFGFSGGLFRFNGISFVNVTKNGHWQKERDL